MNIVDRILDVDSHRAYCLNAKAEDFYYADAENMFLKEDEIEKALTAARIVFHQGDHKIALLLVCKLVDGYRSLLIKEKHNRRNRNV